jgi:cysteinyl-tRNA synthetase
MEFYIYNTESKRKEKFDSIKEREVGIYTCGLTVYNYAHIGNLRTYIFEDVLKKSLEYNGYKVKHVMNITDVGHLQSDGDSGDDKMALGAKRENKSVGILQDIMKMHFWRILISLILKELILNVEQPSILMK